MTTKTTITSKERAALILWMAMNRAELEPLTIAKLTERVREEQELVITEPMVARQRRDLEWRPLVTSKDTDFLLARIEELEEHQTDYSVGCTKRLVAMDQELQAIEKRTKALEKCRIRGELVQQTIEDLVKRIKAIELQLIEAEKTPVAVDPPDVHICQKTHMTATELPDTKGGDL